MIDDLIEGLITGAVEMASAGASSNSKAGLIAGFGLCAVLLCAAGGVAYYCYNNSPEMQSPVPVSENAMFSIADQVMSLGSPVKTSFQSEGLNITADARCIDIGSCSKVCIDVSDGEKKYTAYVDRDATRDGRFVLTWDTSNTAMATPR